MSEDRGLSTLFFAIIFWCIIVNAQPGASSVYLGIEWKANGLTNTLFWIAIVMAVLNALVLTVGEKYKKK